MEEVKQKKIYRESAAAVLVDGAAVVVNGAVVVDGAAVVATVRTDRAVDKPDTFVPS